MNELAQTSIAAYLAHLGARESTPGGGSAAAISAAQAAALIQMVANFTSANIGKPDAVTPDAATDMHAIPAVIERAGQAAEQFMMMAEQDTAAFKQVMQAYRDQDDKALQAALERAAGVPASVIQGSVAFLDDVALMSRVGNQNLITDVAIAAELFVAALRSSELNVLINLQQLKDPAVKTTLNGRLQEIDDATQRFLTIADNIKQSLST